MSVSEKLRIYIEQELRTLYVNSTQSDILLASFAVDDIDEYIETRTKILLSLNLGLFTITKQGAKVLRNLFTDAIVHNKVNYTRVAVQTKIKPNYTYISHTFDSTATIPFTKDLYIHTFYSPCLSSVTTQLNTCVKQPVEEALDAWYANLMWQYIENETIFDVLFALHQMPEVAHVINYLYMRMMYQLTSIAYELVAHHEPYIQYLLQAQSGLLKTRFAELFDRYQQKRLQIQILLLYGLLRNCFQPQIVQFLQNTIKSKEDRLKIELLLTYTTLVKLLMEHIEQTCFGSVFSGVSNVD